MTTGRMHSGGPVNPSQVPTRGALPYSRRKNSRPKQGYGEEIGWGGSWYWDFPNFLPVRNLEADLLDEPVQNERLDFDASKPLGDSNYSQSVV